jgi:putative ABC transport system permease protein
LGSNGQDFNSTGPAVSFALKNDFPEIEEILRINAPGATVVRYTSPDGSVLSFNESKVLAADSNFFSFFDFRLREGDPHSALLGKDKVILSDKAALRLFGDRRSEQDFVGDDRLPLR